MEKKIVGILYVMIIVSFISLIQGKINNNIEGLSTIPSSVNESENIFTDESSISTNIKTSSYPSDLSTPTPEIIDNPKDTKSDISLSSSNMDDKTDITNPNTLNKESIPTYFKTTEIESAIKSDIPTEITSSTFFENISFNPIPPPPPPISTVIKTSIADTIDYSSTIPDTSETIFTTESNIPESSGNGNIEPTSDYTITTTNPSSANDFTFPDTQRITENLFTTNFEDNSTNIFPTNEIPTTNLNFTNSVNIPTAPITSTNQIYNETILTTSPSYPSTIIIYKDTSLVLLGFSHYNKMDAYFSFYIYFGLLKGFIYSNDLKFPVQITYNTNLRLLQNYEANCSLKDKLNLKILYLCEVQIETQNINNIKIIPEFNFILQSPSVVISPFAIIYINNIQDLENQFNINSNLYILRNSKINKGENKIFNISGIINEPLPKFQKVDLVLTVNIENENKETKINCNVIDINNINYIIQCKVNDNKNYTLQNGISIIGDEILLINFDNYDDSRISFYVKTESLGAGPVLAIIIILIFFGYFI